MAKKSLPRPLVLMILDGYGFSQVEEGNVGKMAKQPNIERYLREYPWVGLRAVGLEVGLPWGEMGNSETGHQNIGSGRLVSQPLPRINASIANRSFFKNRALLRAVEHVKKNPDAVLHTMGMLSNGGVHSHIDHQLALIELAAAEGIGDRLYIHVFLDGRDSPPGSAGSFIGKLEAVMQKRKAGRVASIVGRYFAMDRNNNWDRTKQAYDLLVRGDGKQFTTWQEAMETALVKGDTRTYEVAPPMMIVGAEAKPRPIQDGDAVILYNYREDRSVQIASAFTQDNFKEFDVVKWKNLVFVTMADLGEAVSAEIAFPKEKITYTLGRILSEHNLKQLRIAESEKFAHVTYFFNGGREQPYEGEDRVSIPSKNVKDYSQVPEMSAAEISDRVVKEIERGYYDVIIMNYANPDMVGHTGEMKATITALEFLDGEIKQVVDAAIEKGGAVILTCDHGNAEEKKNPITHKQSTSHTINPVPLMYISESTRQASPKDEATVEMMKSMPTGILADVAPTILEIMGIKKPAEMTGNSLLGSLR